MHILVREAEFDDAPLMATLTRAAWAKKVDVTSSGHRETAVSAREHLQEGGGFILSVNNSDAGSVRWLPLESQPDVWEILRLGVIDDFRGSSLSQHLIEAVVHHALVSEVSELRLALKQSQSRLIDIYAAHGFEVMPELDYTHANPLEPAPIVMRRVLRH